MAGSIHGFFRSPLNAWFLGDILGGGLGIEPALEGDPKPVGLSGPRFVLTGTLPGLSRAEAKSRIIAAGGRVLSTASKDTDYVVAGEAAGQKLSAAQSLGVKLIDLARLLAMLGEAG
jgi:DNA ligase (NAD+)